MSQASFHDDATGVVKAIQESVATAILVVEDQEYTTRPVFLAPEKPDSRTLQTRTLTGLAAYVNDGIDGVVNQKFTVVINSPRKVTVESQVGDRKESRRQFVCAVYEPENFPFNRFHPLEAFIILLQARFEDRADRAKVLALVGNLTSQLVQTSVDDGVSQTVVIEQGVRKAAVELPNPVTLAPFRTFPEVDQPASPFILRVSQAKDGQLPDVGLFECDGGRWELDAIENIKNELHESFTDVYTILG